MSKASEFIANEMQAKRIATEHAQRSHYLTERERFARIAPAPKRAPRRSWLRSLLPF